MAKIQLPQSSPEVGFDGPLAVPNIVNNAQFIGAALENLGSKLGEYAEIKGKKGKFEEKEQQREDKNLLLSSNFKGEIEAIIEEWLTPEVYNPDGSLNYRDSAMRAKSIAEDYDNNVIRATGEAEEFVMNLGLESPEVLELAVATTRGQMENFKTDKKEMLHELNNRGDMYTMNAIVIGLTNGIENLLVGEGSELLATSLKEGNSFVKEISNKKTKDDLESALRNARGKWLTSYSKNTEGQMQFIADIDNEVFFDFPVLHKQTQDLRFGLIINLGSEWTSKTLGNVGAGGSSGTGGSPGSLDLSLITAPEVDSLRIILASLDPESREARHLNARISTIDANNLKYAVSYSFSSALSNKVDPLEFSHRVSELRKHWKAGPSEVKRLDDMLFKTGLYNYMEDTQLSRLWTLYQSMDAGSQLPEKFAEQLHGFIAKTEHTPEGWELFRTIGNALARNSSYLPKLKPGPRNLIANTLYFSNLGFPDMEKAHKYAGEQGIGKKDEVGGIGFDIEGILDTSIYVDYSGWNKNYTIRSSAERHFDNIPNDQWLELLGRTGEKGLWVPVPKNPSLFIPYEFTTVDKELLRATYINTFAGIYTLLKNDPNRSARTPQQHDNDAMHETLRMVPQELLLDESTGGDYKLWKINPNETNNIQDINGNIISTRSQVAGLIKDALVLAHPPGTFRGKGDYAEWAYDNGRLIFTGLGTYNIEIPGDGVVVDKNNIAIQVNLKEAIVWEINSDYLRTEEEVELASDGDFITKDALSPNLLDIYRDEYKDTTPKEQIEMIEGWLRFSEVDEDMPWDEKWGFSPWPWTDESMLDLLAVPEYNQSTNEEKLDILKHVVANTRDLWNQEPFIANPITRPYYEEAVGIRAAELLVETDKEKYYRKTRGATYSTRGYPLAFRGANLWSSPKNINELWKPKVDIPIALEMAKIRFLRDEVQGTSQADKNILYKKLQDSVKGFNVKDFVYGDNSIGSITQRAIFRQMTGVETKTEKMSTEVLGSLMKKVNSTLKERSSRPELETVFLKAGKSTHPQGPIYELNGGMIMNPKYYSNAAIMDRVGEPLNGSSEVPWVEIRNIYRAASFKHIPKRKLVDEIYKLTPPQYVTPMEEFDLVRAWTAGLFDEGDANLVFAMDDKRFSGFLWEMLGKERIAVITVDWPNND